MQSADAVSEPISSQILIFVMIKSGPLSFLREHGPDLTFAPSPEIGAVFIYNNSQPFGGRKAGCHNEFL
jgi:hypothetical protein